MAFFENLGKTISHAGYTAVQKTKDMTDTARINSAISDEEKKIKDLYYKIGKLYVSIHPSDYENDFSELMELIKESEIKIRSYQQQLHEIKGIVYCENCGAAIANESAFCSSCGAPISKTPQILDEANIMKCLECGAMIDKTMRFCDSCGKSIADMLQSDPITTSASAEAVTEKRKCHSCGEEAEDEDVFCAECGARL